MKMLPLFFLCLFTFTAQAQEEPAVPLSATVVSVFDQGALVRNVRWIKPGDGSIVTENAEQYIQIRRPMLDQIYEGLDIALHARPAGVVPVSGRRLKQWIHLPKEQVPASFDGKYPHDLE